MQSQFWEDIIKIVLDKLLLGTIAIALTFFLNRFLERFRAANNFEQRIIDEQIAAFKAVSKSLSLLRIQFEKVLALVEASARDASDEFDKAKELDRISAVRAEYRPIFHESLWTIESSRIFLSDELDERVDALVGLIKRFFEANSRLSELKFLVPVVDWSNVQAQIGELEKVYAAYNDNLASVLGALAVEVRKNPFAKSTTPN